MLREEANPAFVFVFSPHPGYPPSYETALFQSWGCLPSNNSNSSASPLPSSSPMGTTKAENAASDYLKYSQQHQQRTEMPSTWPFQSSLSSASSIATPAVHAQRVNLLIADGDLINNTDTGQLVAASNGSISSGSTVGGQSLSVIDKLQMQLVRSVHCRTFFSRDAMNNLLFYLLIKLGVNI